MTETSVAGIYFGGNGASGQSCRVSPTESGLKVHIEGSASVFLDYRLLTVYPAGVNDKYICFSGESDGKPARVLVSDTRIIDRIALIGAPFQVITALRSLQGIRTRRSIYRKTTLAGIVGVILLTVVSIWLGFDAAVAWSVRFFPVAWEEELGAAASDAILAQDDLCSDPELLQAVDEIGLRLVRGLHKSPYAFQVHVLDVPLVNAFALPGGQIFLNRGLIQRADDGFEVAGVMAHEMQHVLQRHGLTQVVRQAGFSLLLSFVLGDAGGLEQFIAANAAEFATMSYSREQEARADADGVDLMRRSSMDPSGLVRFLEKRVREAPDSAEVTALFSSHPTPASRVQALAQLSKAGRQAPVVPLKANWPRVRTRCNP
ncbi:MAG: M48 family metallopeptidase [Myxococcota bacterium]|nr:M48 family metallopeptidase [Myxococcota bacterium]